MTDDPLEDTDVIDDSIESWLSQQAQRQGTSESAVFEQLLSAFWTLQELTQVLEESDRHVARSSDDGEKRLPTATRTTEIKDELGDIQSSLEADGERIQDFEDRCDRLAKRIAEVRDAVDVLEEDLTSLRETQTSQAEALDRLESHMSSEFGHLTEILSYLLKTTDTLETRLSTGTSSIGGDLQSLIPERDRLHDLKQEAATIGIESADCKDCGGTIDLSLLARPRCPHCEAYLNELVTTNRFWVLTDAVVTTSDGPIEPEPEEPVAGGEAQEGSPSQANESLEFDMEPEPTGDAPPNESPFGDLESLKEAEHGRE